MQSGASKTVGEQMKALMYDWNMPRGRASPGRVAIGDETLRDGLQAPHIRQPTLGEKIQLLHMMERLRIDSVDLGMPVAGASFQHDVKCLAKEISECRMKLKPFCAARTLKQDIEPIIRISQEIGIAIEVAMFIGTSPLRRFLENWSFEEVQSRAATSLAFAVNNGLPVMFVTEDTIRSTPTDIERIYRLAIQGGARAITLCDTVGHATPRGVRRLIRFIRRRVLRPTEQHIRLDWHGHNDRGLGLVNSIAAVEEGVDQIHATILGVGERVGNTALDQLIVNLVLLGRWKHDVSALRDYCDLASRVLKLPIPANYPVFGRNAFCTATGTHASALVKARRKECGVDTIYSGVPAELFGLSQTVEIGPLSGKANVVAWLQTRGIEVTSKRVDRILTWAKSTNRTLDEKEVGQLLRENGD